VAALQELTTEATQAATDASLAAAKVEHAVQHMRGIRPDIVFTDDSAGGKRDVVEVKTISFCPSWYGVRFTTTNGDTWVEARVRKAVKERDSTAAKLDAALFPEAWPPPITTQVQSLGGVTAAVIGAFCEHSPEIHAMAELWAARRAPTAADEVDLGFTVPLTICARATLHPTPPGSGGMARFQQKCSCAPALRPHQRHGCRRPSRPQPMR
jgi:hypothetical protein